MEEVLYEKLELRKEHRMNNLEYLGQAMTEAGNEFNPGTAYGSVISFPQEMAVLLNCSVSQVELY